MEGGAAFSRGSAANLAFPRGSAPNPGMDEHTTVRSVAVAIVGPERRAVHAELAQERGHAFGKRPFESAFDDRAEEGVGGVRIAKVTGLALDHDLPRLRERRKKIG